MQTQDSLQSTVIDQFRDIGSLPLRFSSVGSETCSRIAGGNAWMVDAFPMTGLHCHLFSRPSQGSAAGGDIFYVTTCSVEAKNKFLLIDTVGHGEEASALSSQLLALLGPVASRPCNRDMLADLNAMLCDSTAASVFATASAATFNNDEKSWTYAYAGHPNMLLNRDGKWHELKSEGDNALPTGVVCDTPYQQTKIHLKTGDWVLMYSDGVLDIADKASETYTTESMIRLVSRIATRKSEIFFQELVFLLAAINQSSQFDDDVTFILIDVVAGHTVANQSQ